MKRTTVVLSDETAARLQQTARIEGTSVTKVVREAVERHLDSPQRPPAGEKRRLSFAGLYEGPGDDSERVDEVVGEAIERRRGT